MAEYTDSGVLFKNQDKREQKHPDYKGDLTILCEHCGIQSKRPLAAWLKVTRNGSKFMSLSFKPPRSYQQVGAQRDDASF